MAAVAAIVDSSKVKELVCFLVEGWVEGNVSGMHCTCYIKLQNLKAVFVNIEAI